MEELKRIHRAGEWELALHKYHDMRLMLADIRSRHPTLTERERIAIQGAIDQLATIEREVARAVGAGNAPRAKQRYEVFLLEAQSNVDALAAGLM